MIRLNILLKIYLKASFLFEGSSNFLTAILIGSDLYSGNLLMVLLYPCLEGFAGLNGASWNLPFGVSAFGGG